MKKYLLFSFTASLVIVMFNAYAQSVGSHTSSPNQFTPPLCLIRNAGQIRDQHGNARADIQYKSGDNGVSIFVGRGALHYQFRKIIKQFTNAASQTRSFKGIKDAPADSTQYEVYRLDVELAGASPDAQVMEEDGQPYYEQYYTAAAHAAAKCFNKITYKDIYPHIDWVLYIKDNKLEYDFIIKPGGNVKDIQIKYSGATDIAHQEGNIKVTTPMGDINEGKLYAYEQQSGEPVAADFILKNNTLGFSVPGSKQLKHSTLVIDPTLVWGTYYGGDGGTAAVGIACDSIGNILITGTATGTNGIATTGAYQDTLMGTYDAFLAKFTADGNLLWATYYGGAGNDGGVGICIDQSDNIYIVGYTSSNSNITTAGAYQANFGGGDDDAYLAKFSSTGIFLWATYYGGDGADDGNGVICDKYNEVYMSGITNSTNGIATEGCYQSNNGGGNDDVFLVKFDSAGNRQWGTYFGGDGSDNPGFNLSFDGHHSIYLGGYTTSTDSIATRGAWQVSPGGGQDAYLAKFNLDGTLVWSTYYGGAGDDNGSSVATDQSGNVFMCGVTTSNNNIAGSGAYQTDTAGDYDAFVVKFDSSGIRKWGTYYGGSKDDVSIGITCDRHNNIFTSGKTYSTNGISTAGAYQDTLMATYDAFLANFNESGALLWATYYGGTGNTASNSLAIDSSANILMTGYTSSPNNISTSGTYQSVLGGPSNAYVAKFGAFNTGVANVITKFKNLSVYPNPNAGKFTVSCEIDDLYYTNLSIDIFNEKGESVYHSTEPVNNNNNTLNKTLSLSYLTPGMYTMHVSTGKESQAINFSVIR